MLSFYKMDFQMRMDSKIKEFVDSNELEQLRTEMSLAYGAKFENDIDLMETVFEMLSDHSYTHVFETIKPKKLIEAIRFWRE